MGFPNERESGAESTPRRSRRGREGGSDGGAESTPRRARGDSGADESTPRRGRGKDKEESAPRLSRKERKAQAAEDSSGSYSGAFTPVDSGAAPPSGTAPYGLASSSAPQAKTDERVETGPTHRTWSPYDDENRSRGPLWATLGGVAVLGLLGAGLAVMWNAESPGASSPDATRTSAPIPSGPPGKFGYAGSRSTDPDPLTVKELFKSKKFTVSGRAYQMTITSKDKKCGDGVLGTKITKALKAGKCTQMVRASFRDKSGKVIGTVGVANLKTSKNASSVARAAGTADYVKPLAGKDEVTKFLGSGSGGAKVWTHGHYAVMVWFQSKDGVKPDKKSSKTLFRAADDITKATVFKALDARTLTGSRAT